VVFAGGPDSHKGDLVLPVRLPSGAGRWARLAHFLGDPAAWHKIDLVRRRDASAPRGWAYEAHLMVLTGGYASPRPASAGRRPPHWSASAASTETSPTCPSSPCPTPSTPTTDN
jgi:hypothetical protein